MAITFRCPACRQGLSISPKKARTVVACPACGAKVRVPADDPPVLEGIPIRQDVPQTAAQRRPPAPAVRQAPAQQHDADPPEVPDLPEEGFIGTQGAGLHSAAASRPAFEEYPPPRPRVNPLFVALGVAGVFLLALVVFIVAAASGGKPPTQIVVDERGRPVEKSVTKVPKSDWERLTEAQEEEKRKTMDSAFAWMLIYLLIALPIGLVLYVVPSVVAYWRKHKNRHAILALNMLLGWLFVGWVLALVWALTESRNPSEVHLYHHNPHNPPQAD